MRLFASNPARGCTAILMPWARIRLNPPARMFRRRVHPGVSLLELEYKEGRYDTRCEPVAAEAPPPGSRGRSSMAEPQPSKLVMRVRFPSPAPTRNPRSAMVLL